MLHIHAIAHNELAPVTPVSGVIPDGGGTIGRGEGNTVVLSDPSRMVSRRHLSFAPDGRGGFLVSNISAGNPVLVNERELDAGMSCPVGAGDCIRIGNFMLELRQGGAPRAPGPAPLDYGDQAEIARLTGLEEQESSVMGAQARGPGAIADDFLSDLLGESPAMATAAPLRASEPAGDYDVLDAFVRATPRPADPVDQLGEQGLELSELGPRGDALINADDAPSSIAELTRDPLLEPARAARADAFVDPLALFDDARLAGIDLGLAGGDANATGANHGSDLEGLFRLPAAARAPLSGPIPGDPLAGLDAAGDDLAPVAAPPAVSPAVRKSGGDDLPLPVFDWNEPPEPAVAAPPPPLPASAEGPGTRPVTATPGGTAFPPPAAEQWASPERVTAGRSAMPPAVAQAPQADSKASAPADALYRAFLEGLGLEALPDRAGLDPEFMRLVGGILRSCAQGTVDLMGARAAVKREVKAHVTLIAPARNNPLKFSPDGEVALMYLLGRPYPGFMTPVDAVNHAFADLRAHQLGMISGMRSALGHVLERFDPEVIDREALRAGLVDSLLSIGRKARLWDAYGRYFQNTRESAEDRFQEFFGAVFVDAYEEAATSSRAAFRAGGEARE